jgi:hypothetical protein
MPSYFVWSVPSYAVIVEAASEQDAAEAFLEQPVKSTASEDEPPACYVQPADDADAPSENGRTVEFWINQGSSA